MWLLPTYGRPSNLDRFLENYKKTKCTLPVMIIIDHDDPARPEYESRTLPDNWQWFINDEKLPVGHIYNKVFKAFPDEPFYGTFSDDLVPETDYWDVMLVEAAGHNCVAWGDDGIRGDAVVGGCAIGGDLVREMGYIFLPTLKHFYSDDWLTEIARRRNALRYIPEVKVIHHHFTTGKSEYDATYARRDGLGDKENYEQWLKDNPIKVGDTIFVCVNSGNYCGRGVEYVNILFDMVKRNISDQKAFQFQVFTDSDDEVYSEGIDVRKLPGNLSGWWNKLYLFKRGLFDENARLVFLDLDTVIVGGLDNLISYTGEFATLRDFWRPHGLGPAIITWRNGGRANEIWDTYQELGCPQEELPNTVDGRGDQWYLQFFFFAHQVTTQWKPDILQDLYPSEFVSYKTSCQLGIPPNAKVVCFHGVPRPHEVTDYWVPNIWKIGGGSTMEFEFVMNTDESELKDNIKKSFLSPHEHLSDQYMTVPEGHVVICGGGPSLADKIEELKWRQADGQVIWALNNAFKYLINNGVYPDAQIILDGREENSEFIPESTKATLLLASQCHADTFAKAEASGGKVIIWHRYIDDLFEMAGANRIAVVQTGTTVGMNALGLAQLFGLKYVHLYGYDSSYREGKNHAYEQPLNNSERVIDVRVNDRAFKCAPWMAVQCNEFAAAVNGFITAGMEFSVHDDGMFGYKASMLEPA